MFRGIACILLGCVGIVGGLAWTVQAETYMCAGGYVGDCYCKYDGSIYYYCKGFQRLTYLCNGPPGTCDPHDPCWCTGDKTTITRVCQNASCGNCIDGPTNCQLNAPNCNPGYICQVPP